MDNNAAIERVDEYQAKGIVGVADTVTETSADLPPTPELGFDEHVTPSGNVSCEHCTKPFWPRVSSGGKKQKFCSEKCRRAADADRKANAKPGCQREANRAENSEPPPSETSDAPAALQEPELEPLATFAGGIPRQYEIAVKSINGESALGNDVEISQEGEHGWHPEETCNVIVNSANVVRLCRQILWAHGWKDIEFHTGHGKGLMRRDVSDGDEPGECY